jgi:hypothetical protein
MSVEMRRSVPSSWARAFQPPRFKHVDLVSASKVTSAAHARHGKHTKG